MLCRSAFWINHKQAPSVACIAYQIRTKTISTWLNHGDYSGVNLPRHNRWTSKLCHFRLGSHDAQFQQAPFWHAKGRSDTSRTHPLARPIHRPEPILHGKAFFAVLGALLFLGHFPEYLSHKAVFGSSPLASINSLHYLNIGLRNRAHVFDKILICIWARPS